MKKTPTDAEGATTVDVASILAELHAPFEHADAMRASSLGEMASARAARGYMLLRKRNELRAVLGAEAAPVAALESSINANAKLAKSLASLSNLAASPPPAPVPDEMIVHGFVRDAAGKPVAGVKVAIAYPGGETLTTASTRKDGHFTLRQKTGKSSASSDNFEVRVLDKRHPATLDVERGDGVAVLMVHLED